MTRLFYILFFLGLYSNIQAQCEIEITEDSKTVCINAPTTFNAHSTSNTLIHWYDSTQNEIATGDVLNLISQTSGIKKYYAKIDGCEEFHLFTLNIQENPLPIIPAIREVNIFEEFEPYTNLGETTGILNWYDVEKNTLLYSGNSFTPRLDSVGTFTYYVKQSTGNCTTEAVPFTLLIVDKCDKKEPFIVQQNFTLTYGDTIPELEVIPEDPAHEIYWYNADLEKVSTGKTYTPQININQNGHYEIYAKVQKDDNCLSNTSKVTIDINCGASTPNAIAQSYTSTSGSTPTTIEAVNSLQTNEEFVWTYNEVEINNNASFTPNISEIGEHLITLGIRNTSTECLSETKEVTYIVLPCKGTPTFTSDSIFNLTLNERIPALTTLEEEVIWYDSYLNEQFYGNTFQPHLTTPGNYTFYVRQQTGNCFGSLAQAEINIKAYTISGKVYFDKDNNGIYNSEDIVIPQCKVLVEETGDILSTDENGNFIFITDTYGTYTFSTEYTEELTILSESSIKATISENTPDVTDIDFRYELPNANDVKLNITSYNLPVVGKEFIYKIDVFNKGIVQTDVTIVFTFDNTKCSFKSTEWEANIISENKIEFTIDSLYTFENQSIEMSFEILPDWKLSNTPFSTDAKVEILSSDDTPEDNTAEYTLNISNVWNPNEKTVSPSLQTEGFVLMESKLDYTIRFQNKGTAPAYNIYIVDTIDSHLDINTLRIVSQSHNMHYKISDRVVTFYFENIELPYESQNSNESFGFIRYEIEPETSLEEETEITNTAYIYFDYNPAVITNTTKSIFVTEIPIFSNVKSENMDTFSTIKIGPNPTQGIININIPTDSDYTNFTISTINGKSVYSHSISNSNLSLDLGFLPQGIYNITFDSESGIFESTIIKK